MSCDIEIREHIKVSECVRERERASDREREREREIFVCLFDWFVNVLVN